MDAETYKVVRSSQLSQLAACYPSVQLKEDQAQALQASVSDSSSQPFLAAVVLFLARFASPSDMALAVAPDASDQVALAEAASRLAAECVNCASASRSSIHDTSLALKSPAGNSSQGGAGHSASPSTGVEDMATSFDNGGSRSTRLQPSSSGDEQAPLLASSKVPDGAALIANLVPPKAGHKAFQAEVPLGPQSGKILAQYLDRVDEGSFTYKVLQSEVRTDDFARLLDAVPKPRVEDGLFSLAGWWGYDHPASAQHVNADFKITKEAAAKKAALLPQQKKVRALVGKVLLPSAEVTKELALALDPGASPEELSKTLFEAFAPDEDEDFDKLSELQADYT